MLEYVMARLLEGCRLLLQLGNPLVRCTEQPCIILQGVLSQWNAFKSVGQSRLRVAGVKLAGATTTSSLGRVCSRCLSLRSDSPLHRFARSIIC